MHFLLLVSLASVGLFVGMIVLLYVGRRIGARQIAKDPEHATEGTGTIDAALFGLLGLLLAFTFSGAAERFDHRRHLVIEETNAIGTAYLRLELVPAEARPELQELFRHYLDGRIEVYRLLPDLEAAKAQLALSATLQRAIWTRAVAAVQLPGAPPAAAILLLPALNTMIDITTTRTMASQMHPPLVIFVMLFGMALVAALLAGYGMARRTTTSWIHILGFAAVMAAAVFVIVDLEYPRFGMIRVDSFDRALTDLRGSMR